MNEFIENLGKVAMTVDNNAWDITKKYSKLTIVKKTPSTLTAIPAIYMSIKDVPENKNITDTDYWLNIIPELEPGTQQPSDWTATEGVTRILNKPTIPENVVKYVEQSLTNVQKGIARNNIGALGSVPETPIVEIGVDVDSGKATISKLDDNHCYIIQDKFGVLQEIDIETIDPQLIRNSIIRFTLPDGYVSDFAIKLGDAENPTPISYIGDIPSYTANTSYIATVYDMYADEGLFKIEQIKVE